MPIDPLQELTGVSRQHPLLAAAALVRQTVTKAAPDRARARAHYRAMARTYELRTASGDPWRREIVTALAPRAGELILEVGCGTGRNFEQIQHWLGPTGRLIGVDQSPEMLAHAHALVERRGWSNVELVEAGAEDFAIPATVDAAMLCAVHDVMRSPAGLTNVVRHVREGGRVIAGGAKWAPWQRPGAVSLNLSTWRLNRNCVSTFEGFRRPWTRLQEVLPGLHVHEMYLGGGYIAYGTIPSGAR
jgi:demethylmenaquinone methyltransferase/2-methoxy-6-polyprenyl-1,4-benzoquinol methylase